MHAKLYLLDSKNVASMFCFGDWTEAAKVIKKRCAVERQNVQMYTTIVLKMHHVEDTQVTKTINTFRMFSEVDKKHR